MLTCIHLYLMQIHTLCHMLNSILGRVCALDYWFVGVLYLLSRLQQSCVLMTHVISSIALSRKPLVRLECKLVENTLVLHICVSPARLSTPTTAKAPHLMEVPSTSFSTETPIGRSCLNVLKYAQNCTDLQSLPISSEVME